MNIDKTTYKALTNIDHKEAADKKAAYLPLVYICSPYAPFGHFIKRNLTCAAGNLFSNMHNQNYNELYISLTKEMAGSEIRMNRLTAFFLIENSIDAESTELHPKLKEILLELRLDKDLFAHYYERIQKLLS